MNHVPLSRYAVFFLLAAGGLAADLFSKSWVFDVFGGADRQGPPWLAWLWGDHVFRLQTGLNHGALFGMGQGYSWLFAGLSVVAAVGFLYWLFVHGAAKSWWLTVALGLVTAGALGNLYDRLGLHGLVDPRTGELQYAVRDFLYFELIDWPIFNLADTFLVIGATMLAIQSLRAEQPQPKAATAAAPAQVPAAT